MCPSTHCRVFANTQEGEFSFCCGRSSTHMVGNDWLSIFCSLCISTPTLPRKSELMYPMLKVYRKRNIACRLRAKYLSCTTLCMVHIPCNHWRTTWSFLNPCIIMRLWNSCLGMRHLPSCFPTKVSSGWNYKALGLKAILLGAWVSFQLISSAGDTINISQEGCGGRNGAYTQQTSCLPFAQQHRTLINCWIDISIHAFLYLFLFLRWIPAFAQLCSLILFVLSMCLRLPARGSP